jgi:hypothetical protein
LGQDVVSSRIGVFALAALLGTASLRAADMTEQTISVQPAVQDVAANGVATVTLVYDATESALAGVGLRLHYDSSKLQLEDAHLLYSTGTMGHQDQPDAGSEYADQFDDGDPATDRRYLAAWSDLSAKWPGNGTLPLPLLELRFRVKGSFDTADLRVTGNACGGCRLLTHSAKVRLAGTPAQSHDPTPSAPTATTTPTPSAPETLGPPADNPLVPLGGAQPVGIPTLSDFGALLFGGALAACAVLLLLRRRS